MPQPRTPPITTEVTGGTILASDINTLSGAVQCVMTPEQVSATASAVSIPNGTSTTGWTAITSLTATILNDATISAGVITIAWGETYDLTYLLQWALSTAGRRKAVIKRISSGVTSWILPSDTIPSLAGPTYMPDGTTACVDAQSAGTAQILAAGDTIQIYVWQDSGAALLVNAHIDLVYLND